VLLLALGAAFAHAADRGIYTVIDGDARLGRIRPARCGAHRHAGAQRVPEGDRGRM